MSIMYDQESAPRRKCRGCHADITGVWITVEGYSGKDGPAGTWHIDCYAKTVARRSNTAPSPSASDKIDAAYTERNKVVAALAAMALVLGYPVGTKKTNIPGWDAEWHGCVYIDLPTGQISFHYHDRDSDLFAFLPPYEGEWDGHDTEEKYKRLLALTSM